MMLVLGQDTPSGPISLQTLCGITCLVWMSRSWTYQEAALAPDWHIEGMADIGLMVRGLNERLLAHPSWATMSESFSIYVARDDLNGFYSDISAYVIDNQGFKGVNFQHISISRSKRPENECSA